MPINSTTIAKPGPCLGSGEATMYPKHQRICGGVITPCGDYEANISQVVTDYSTCTKIIDCTKVGSMQLDKLPCGEKLAKICMHNYLLPYKLLP